VLGKILPFRRKQADGRVGFIYAPDGETGPMSEAQPGQIVRVEGRGPPWIVVDEVPASIVLAKWPGTLWRAMIVEAATADDQRSRGGPPLPYARYTRCIAVEILGKEDLSMLFGEHGQEVLAVLERATLLTRDQALNLSSGRHNEASDAYERAFRRWANAEGIGIEAHDGNLDGTLKIGSMPAESPVNEGLSLIHLTVFDRAKAVDGSIATHIDERGDEDLVEPWSGAGAVLLDAALALGAPDFVNERDRHILTEGFVRAFSAP
jgi:hypothetical protein